MDTVLWVLQGVLAAVFLGAGLIKLVRGKEQLLSLGAWTKETTPTGMKLLGAAEVLGAVGVLVPSLTGIAVLLAPVAAVCLAVTMVGAVAAHLKFRETKEITAPIVLLIAAVLVAWGRFGPYAL